MRHCRFASAALLAAIAACSTVQAEAGEAGEAVVAGEAVANAPAAPDTAYPGADEGLGERLYPNEQALGNQIASVIEGTLRAQYAPGHARRDAHPKAHGCVKAVFQVDQGIPAALAQGIFIPGKTYPAWIRFSNGSQDPGRADIKGDARGMAIKVMDVPGEKLLESERNATTQDFILINHPVFFANEPRRYLSVVAKSDTGGAFSKLTLPFSLGFRGTLISFETTRSKIANPLSVRYWSMVPYQLGIGPERQAVKVSVKPCSEATPAIPRHPGHDYLRDALRTTLDNGDACMELLVQPRTSARMSVEDSMTEWSEQQAPFYKVATLVIPRQTFDTPAQNLFCENLSFTPWHALPEHRPLGVTNRLRKVIYERISRLRHEMNSAERREP